MLDATSYQKDVPNMRTIRTKLYKFEELSREAKETAIEQYRNEEQEFHWSSEWLDSLEKALTYFDIELTDYSIDWGNINGCYTSISFKDEDIENMNGIRLWKYIQKNYSSYYCGYDKKYKNTLDGNCPFTGYCGDENFLDPIRNFIKKPTNISFTDLIEDCIYELLKGGCNDWEYQQSDEAIEETIEANEYEFLKNGTRY